MPVKIDMRAYWRYQFVVSLLVAILIWAVHYYKIMHVEVTLDFYYFEVEWMHISDVVIFLILVFYRLGEQIRWWQFDSFNHYL